MMKLGREFNPIVVQAIHRLRALGKYRIISLTNNFSAVDPSNLPPPPLGFNQKYPDFVSVEAEIKSLGWHQGVAPPQLTNLFDDFCDSSLVGMRKPEPEFYLAACRRNRVHPRECVFLDDLRMNLKTAKALGMQTIHVPVGGSLGAVRQLEKILDVDLTSAISAAIGASAKL